MALVIDSPKKVVLVVEDQSVLRLIALAMIEDAGFDVIEAQNADEAIEILERRSDIRIVFTDIEMPGSMDGVKLAHAIRGRWPPVELILTSGHRVIRDEELPERGHFFAKPFQWSKVVETMHQLAA